MNNLKSISSNTSGLKLCAITLIAIFGAASCKQQILNERKIPVDKLIEQQSKLVNSKALDSDPYLWLEEIHGEKATDFVNSQNEIIKSKFQSDPRFEQFKKISLDVMDAKDKIADPSLVNGQVENFWKDETNPKGIWRRTSLNEYLKDSPRWETILDVDALAKSEKENWVYKGGACLSDKSGKCLLTLSRDGKDASVIREFDRAKKEFIKDGFNISESKGEVVWIDENTLMVGTDMGKDTMTDSGYPRTTRIWKRGEKLEDSKLIYTGEKTDVGVWPMRVKTSENTQLNFITRSITFYDSEYFLINDDLSITKLPIPKHAELTSQYIDGKILLTIQKDWAIDGETHFAGSLVSVELDKLIKESKGVSTVLKPHSRMSIDWTTATKDFLYVAILENVSGKVLKLTPKNGKWEQEEIALPENGNASISSIDDITGDVIFSHSGFLNPTTLYISKDNGKTLKEIKSLPHRFDSSLLQVQQFEATSKDGTKIPYYMISKKDIELNSSNPTLLYGYGGFQVSLTPRYSSLMGKLWLEKGGVYVRANIRGGGEFGPKWHQAALKENRQKAFDDFIAVAEDLISKKVTSPKHLGIEGGSNGGLLVGAVSMQRPELFNAVICAVPLLDMLRFHKLLAGASWVGEYGNAELDPRMRSEILKYSPYHNVYAQQKYPEILFTTSTADDRVHPGHARKMAKKMLDLGHQVYLYENTEGGHAGAADNSQAAKGFAIDMIYLHQKLF